MTRDSWNFFAGEVQDKDSREAAEELVATGMRDAGYTYVNIGDYTTKDRGTGLSIGFQAVNLQRHLPG